MPRPGAPRVLRFRRQALAKLGDADQLDIPVRLTRPRTWVAVVAIAALVVSGLTFLVTGSLPRNFAVAGVVGAARGNFRVQTLQQGQVTEVHVGPGTRFDAAQPLLRLRTATGSLDVVAAEAGRVLSLLAVVGQVVPAGGTVAVAARTGRPGDRQVAMLFAPVSEAFRMSPGDRVDVAVDSAPRDTFGVVSGRVVSVAPIATDARQLALLLATDGAPTGTARGAGGAGRVRLVTVELDRARTASGYRWSTSAGPPTPVEAGASVIGTIHEAPIRPIEWLLP